MAYADGIPPNREVFPTTPCDDAPVDLVARKPRGESLLVPTPLLCSNNCRWLHGVRCGYRVRGVMMNVRFVRTTRKNGRNYGMLLETVPLTENLSVIRGNNRGRFPMSHVFLVQDRVSALIDTGCGLDLLALVQTRFPVDLIINSHGHPDHTSGNWMYPDVPLYAPRVGADSHGRLLPLSHRFLGAGELADHWRQWIPQITGFRDREPTDYFDDGHVFDFGKLKLHAIHTPGHTRDHFCLYEPENRILLSFDIDLTPFGPWYGNLESNLVDFRNSLEQVRRLNPLTIASSHAEVVAAHVARSVDQYAHVLDRRSDTLKRLLERGPSRDDIINAAPIYGHHPFEPELLRWFEARMIDLHLEEMISLGTVRTDGQRFWLV
jgi:endoribonuclease LACTB2